MAKPQKTEEIRHRVASLLHGEKSASTSVLELLLHLFSFAYGALVAFRSGLYKSGFLAAKRLPCRVVSVGNLTVGGTGKTPLTILLARMLKERGCRVVVISRGYGGRLEKRGGIVSNGETVVAEAKEAGDEPCLMARQLKGIPVVVGRRRYDAGLLAIDRFHPDVIVLDDGFQHLRLHRDLNLLLLDHRSPFGNGHCLPRGVLREPLSGLRRADAIVFTRSSHRRIPPLLNHSFASLPIFFAQHHPVVHRLRKQSDPFLKRGKGIVWLKRKKVLAFAGLADNAQFFDTLTDAGCDLIHTLAFPDHHFFSPGDLDQIAAAAKRYQVDLLVTTLKDFVRLKTDCAWPVELIVVDVQVRMPVDDPLFSAFITDRLR